MGSKILYLVIGFFVVLGLGYLLGHNNALGPTGTIPTPRISRFVTHAATPSTTSTPSQKTTEVKIFLVALSNSQVEFGPQFGCGDSVEPVVRQVPATSMPLTAALIDLLSMKSQYYGDSGLYNALFESDLKVSHADVSNGVATVYLTGVMKLGGVCDDPRVEEQITKTVMQFSTVKEAKIYINNIPLHDAVSEK